MKGIKARIRKLCRDAGWFLLVVGGEKPLPPPDKGKIPVCVCERTHYAPEIDGWCRVCKKPTEVR